MKKIFSICLVTLFLGFATTAAAQDDTSKVKKAAKKTANKTAEVASKGVAKVADQELKDKAGPTGEKIYINGQSKYYYVDKKGHKQYLKESELKTRINN